MITYDDYSSPDYLQGSEDAKKEKDNKPKKRRLLRKKAA
jgi:hypothetical protein